MNKKGIILSLFCAMIFLSSTVVYASSCDICGCDGLVTKCYEHNVTCPWCQKLGFLDASCSFCHGSGVHILMDYDVREGSYCSHITCDICGGDGFISGYVNYENMCGWCQHIGFLDDDCHYFTAK